MWRCRGGSLRALPQPLGLPTFSTPSVERFLASPVYAGLSGNQRQLEREAYSNQQQLELGEEEGELARMALRELHRASVSN